MLTDACRVNLFSLLTSTLPYFTLYNVYFTHFIMDYLMLLIIYVHEGLAPDVRHPPFMPPFKTYLNS